MCVDARCLFIVFPIKNTSVDEGVIDFRQRVLILVEPKRRTLVIEKNEFVLLYLAPIFLYARGAKPVCQGPKWGLINFRAHSLV